MDVMFYRERRIRIREILGVHPKLKDHFGGGDRLTAHEITEVVAKWAKVQSLSVEQAWRCSTPTTR